MVGLKLARDRGPTGPIEIAAIRTSLLWSGSSQAQAVVMVENKSADFVEAQVWWIVASVGDPRPWVDPVLLSPTSTIALKPHAHAIVPINGTKLPRDGSYTLSAWVHTVRGDESVPSDGVALSAGLTVLAANTALKHTQTWDHTLEIASATRHDDASHLTIATTVTNTALRVRTIRVAVTAGGNSVTAEGVIDAASSSVVTVNLPKDDGGTATLTVESLNPDGAAVPADEVSMGAVTEPRG